MPYQRSSINSCHPGSTWKKSGFRWFFPLCWKDMYCSRLLYASKIFREIKSWFCTLFSNISSYSIDLSKLSLFVVKNAHDLLRCFWSSRPGHASCWQVILFWYFLLKFWATSKLSDHTQNIFWIFVLEILAPVFR